MAVRVLGVKLLCRLLGHKLPRPSGRFLASDRLRRCERCGQRVPSSNR